MGGAGSLASRLSMLVGSSILIAFWFALSAAPVFAGTAEEINALPNLDSLNRNEEAFSNGGRWGALSWDTSSSGHSTGHDTTSGWGPYDAFSTVNGAYWTVAAFNDKTGDAAAVTMPTSPGIAERYVALWLDMASPGTAKSGYQLRWTMTNASTNTYSLTLSLWSAGSQTVLASNASVVIAPGAMMAISDTGGTVSAWQGTGGSLNSVLSAPDSTLTSGYTGVEGSGNFTRLTNFKAGALLGGAISTVPVLDNLERQEVPLATGGWSKTSWAGEIGGAWMGTYRGYGASSGLAGAYWNSTSFSDGGETVEVVGTVGTGSPWEGEYLALWLDMPSPSSARSGYEARFTGTNGTSTAYKVELSKWVSGTRTVLASTSGFSLPVNTTMALTETSGGGLVLWTGSTAMTPILTASDSTYASGYAGLEVNGLAGTIYNFRAGRIYAQRPAAPTLMNTSPISPSNDSTPLITGSAASGTTVKLFTNSTCSGNAVASGTAATLASPGIQVKIAEDTTTKLYATATDELGAVSVCSGSISYTELSKGTNTAVESLTTVELFATPENPLSDEGKWTKLASASNTGQVQGSGASGGWGPYSSFPAVAGAFWNKESFSDSGTGVAVAATLSAAPSLSERYFSLWLDMPSPENAQTGYELRFTQTATANVYSVTMSKWQSGTRTTLATAASYSFSPQGLFALVDNGGKVSAWTDTGSGYGQLLTASDVTFEKGYVGLEGAGNVTRIREFQANASTKRIGQAEFIYDPNTNTSTYIPQPGAPAMSAQPDPADGTTGGNLPLPETEDWVTCATTGHRIVVVYSSGANPATPPTSTRNEILSIVRRMNSKIVRESLRSSGNTRALTMKVDCDETGAMRIYGISSVANDTDSIIAATETALGKPQGSEAVKYLIFRDANMPSWSQYDGIGYFYSDSTKTSSDSILEGNKNRVNTTSSVTYRWALGESVWPRDTALHELVHTMGAVLPDAPFATTKGHCTDGLDVMCYADGGGNYTTTRCPASEGYETPIGVPLDCGYDTYFDAATEPGEWLSTHWNIGGSENPFLAERPANVPPGGFQTAAFVTVTQVRNGRPGSVSLEGNVNITNATGEFVNNAYANVNFEKWENGAWITETSVHPTITNGHYEVSDSGGLGVGSWRVRTVFPEQGYYRESVSNYHEFTIQPIPTETFLTLDSYKNGTPGTASVSGNVLHSGNPVEGTVNVNFQKYENGQWETKSTAQRTLANGHYEVVNWGVGVGQWRVRAVFPEQGNYAQSESSYHEFSIQPVPTETFLTLDGYKNGAPGTASVSGNVLHNGVGVSGTVNVNFEKWNGSSWQTMSTAQRTLSNGHYEVVNWGVGVGQWRVRAVFPEQGNYAQSESSYHEFSIQPVPTETFLTVDKVVQGTPGNVSVSGNVLYNGGGVSGTVNVNFEKWNGSSWQTMSTAQRTLSNGHYEVVNWGVGAGKWRVRAVFPEQGDYGYSASGYHEFSI